MYNFINIFVKKLIILCMPLVCMAQNNTTTAIETIKTIPIDGYAAKVNQTIITRSDVRATMAPVLSQLYSKYEGTELDQKLEEAYVNAREQLIDQALIVIAFEKQGGQIPDYFVNNEIDRIIRTRFNVDKVAFEQSLSKDQITYDDYVEKIRNNITSSVLMNEQINQRAKISPEAVRIFYEANRYRYLIPEKIRYSVIMLNSGATLEEKSLKKNNALLIMKKLNSGEDFNLLAKEFSEGARANQGGSYPWLQLKDIDKSLHQYLNQLRTGEISSIIEIKDQLLILKVDARRNAAYQPFSEVRESIKDKLIIIERDRLYNEWMNRLKEKHYIIRYN